MVTTTVTGPCVMSLVFLIEYLSFLLFIACPTHRRLHVQMGARPSASYKWRWVVTSAFGIRPTVLCISSSMRDTKQHGTRFLWAVGFCHVHLPGEAFLSLLSGCFLSMNIHTMK